MNLISLRIVTGDIKRLIEFFEKITDLKAIWYNDDFAELVTVTSTIAIGSTKTLAVFGGEIAQPASNKSVIIEFKVDNVDEDYERIKDFVSDIVQEPATMPWGNRSLRNC